MATIEELEAAERELTIVEKRWENYDGNNPNKHRAALSDAQAKVATLRQVLKASGELVLSKHEQLEKTLDAMYPNAQSRQVVEYEGSKYRRTFTPVAKSLSGKTVKAWNKSWYPLDRSIELEAQQL